MDRRGLLRLLGIAALPGSAAAQTARGIRLVVPTAPGILPDILGRLLAAALEPVLGEPVAVDNRAGANGIIAATHVARAPADGSVLMLAGASVLSFNPALYDTLPYDPLGDFTYIAPVADTPFMIVASRRSGFTTLADFVAAAKARPGEVSYTSVGIGNTTHLAMEMVADIAGIDLLHVPVSTGNPMTSLIAGEVDALAGPVSSLLAQARAGTVVPLAVMTPARLPELPQTPSLEELGVAAPPVPGWYAVLGPAGLPEAITQRLAAAVRTTIATPAVQQRMAQLLLTPLPGDAATLRAQLDQDLAVWGGLIRRKGLRLG